MSDGSLRSMTTPEKGLIAIGIGVFTLSSAYWIAAFALAWEWWTR
jgi:hypothetical protein